MLRHAETLAPEGRINQENLRGAQATDIFFLEGIGEETHEPRFTYHGFRYVEVEAPQEVQIHEIRAKVLHTDVRRTGFFTSSHEELNQLYNAVIWTERSNMHSVPTDCPQRDERMAWLNDMTVRCEAASIHFDLVHFYRKWMDDLADEQSSSGYVPDTAPYIYGGNPAQHISSCMVLVPWLMYLNYGDETTMRKFYGNMRRYLLFLDSQTAEDGILKDKYYGEWAAPIGVCHEEIAWSALPKDIPSGLVTTGYLYYVARTMELVASHLDYPQDVNEYSEIAKKAKAAINLRYFNLVDGCYFPGSQGSNIFPLYLGIVPDGQHERVFRNLLQDLVNHRQYHLTTGNQMTKYLFEVLDQGERNDVALALLENNDYPGFGYMLANGATTIWERWERLEGGGMNSHNHPMHGAFSSWFYKTLGGIRLDRSGGILQGLRLEPQTEIGLDFVAVEYESVKGPIRMAWRKQEGSIHHSMEIPWNLPAVFVLKLPANPFRIEMDGREIVFEGSDANAPDGITCRMNESGEKLIFSIPSGQHDIVLLTG